MAGRVGLLGTDEGLGQADAFDLTVTAPPRLAPRVTDSGQRDDAARDDQREGDPQGRVFADQRFAAAGQE